jgi:hypothetical protein
MNQFPSSPRVSHKDRFEFFRKFAEFAAYGAPPVSLTPVAILKIFNQNIFNFFYTFECSRVNNQPIGEKVYLQVHFKVTAV